ncbi:hypothetical protein [Sedimenticola sp.]|uniref:hypothetical protein n=1 Tax=Sedimenticola sp. TaxID=1940285 RepID=UPI003D099351
MELAQMEEVGFLKYDGEDATKGVIDAASAGSALIGLDEAIRFFNERQSSEFARLDYQIPVKIGEGSWVAVVLGGVGLVTTAFALGYAKKAGEKLAENDIGEKTSGEILKKSMSAIQSLIRLIKHTKQNKDWDTKNIQWKNGNELIGIPNSRGEHVFIPFEHFKWISEAPRKILVRVTEVVSTKRILSIGVKEDGGFDEVQITPDEKLFFSGTDIEPDEEDFLFPELEHGQRVKLEGKLTRGNESSNSVGFEYQGHILNCIPDEGSIVQYKPALFLKCVVEGTITRLTRKRNVAERRPTIIVKRVTPLENDEQHNLF